MANRANTTKRYIEVIKSEPAEGMSVAEMQKAINEYVDPVKAAEAEKKKDADAAAEKEKESAEKKSAEDTEKAKKDKESADAAAKKESEKKAADAAKAIKDKDAADKKATEKSKAKAKELSEMSLEELSEDYFERFPKVDKFYATPDRTFFFKETKAQNHCGDAKKVKEFARK